MPQSKTDAIAIKHDLDYFIYNDSPLGVLFSDARAIEEAPWTLEGAAMKVGLFLRGVSGLDFYSQKDASKAKSIGLLAKQYVKDNPNFQKSFAKYGVRLKDW